MRGKMYTKLIKHYFGFLSLVVLSFILAGCATTPTQTSRDGAPKYYVDASKIPDAVPTKLPLDKAANPSSYTVNGHTYHVLKSPKNYVAVGTASWYGTKFDGHNTSSGQPYNLLQMTAASKVLPIPCFAKVTNLKTGKSVIVEVNDRGPFEKGRLMDLSYAAALKLDIVGHGTARVRVATIDPATYHKQADKVSYAANTKHVDSHHPIYIQAAALHDKIHAEHLVAQLKQNLHEPANVYASGKLYRVKIGPLHSDAAAQNVIAKLQQDGINNPIYA